MINGNFGRDPDLRGDAQVLACLDDGVVQEAKQVRILMPHDLLDQRERLRKIRRTSVRPLELVQQFVAVEVCRQLPFAHIQSVRIAFQRQREQTSLPFCNMRLRLIQPFFVYLMLSYTMNRSTAAISWK